MYPVITSVNQNRIGLANPNKLRNTVLGRHSVIELYDCDASLLADVSNVREVLIAAAQCCKATIVEVVFHEFNPYGVSGVVVISESHLAIHTWPEHRYAAIDLFTCGETLSAEPAAEYLAKGFKARSWEIYKIPRGRFDIMGRPVQTPLHINSVKKGASKKTFFPSLQNAVRFLFDASFLQFIIDYFG